MAKAKSWCETEGYKNLALLLARVAVGVIFILAGWGKFQDMDAVVSMFDGWGFPAAAFFAWLTALVEFVGGIGLVLGIFTKLWSMLLGVTMLVAILAVHVPGGHDFNSVTRLPLALFAATVAMSSVGGGMWKVWSKECPWS